jgi:predicted acyl esterase
LSYRFDVPTTQEDAQVEELAFEYFFNRRTYLMGYSKAVLYMSTTDCDDMDVFVCLCKVDAEGKVLRNINIPLKDLKMNAEEVPLLNSLVYIGPSGILRASHRKVDETKSKPHWPFHPHDERQPVRSGEVVKLEIEIWPAGIVYEPGEKLSLRVAGHHMVLAEFEPLRGEFQNANKGYHTVHVGPEYPSYLVLPLLESEDVLKDNRQD